MHDELIHRAVARHAQEHPEAIALVHAKGRLTYRELDDLAEDWAARLVELGVGPGTIVPVCLPRSLELVAALLGVLKCGSAYAALDRRWPEERLDLIARSLPAPVAVAEAGERRTFGGLVTWHPPAEPPSRRLTTALHVEATAPASVFFTSGTTGRPKGVLSPHRATTRLFAHGGPMEFGRGHVMLQGAPIPWDAFTLELWGMLTTGGTAVLIEGDYLLPGTLAESVETEGVNTVWLTVSLFNLFVEEDLDSFSGVERVFIGGERVSPSHAARFMSSYPDISLFNGYGPVESCVFATVHRVLPADCAAEEGIPIGRPVPATGVHVLEDGRELPPGDVGELCVSGAGLATGYLNDESLTAVKFPHVDLDGKPVRVYRTGDRGFLRPDGVFCFSGRADRQLKVRGHRIEPGEIEAHSNALTQVAQSVLVPVTCELGSVESLALFYTPADAEASKGDGTDEERAIRLALGLSLPAYAVPDQIHRITRIPITPNGKTDRSALEAMLARK